MKKRLAIVCLNVVGWLTTYVIKAGEKLNDLEQWIFDTWVYEPESVEDYPQGPFQLPDGRWVLNRVPGLIGYYPSKEAAQFAFEAWQRRQAEKS